MATEKETYDRIIMERTEKVMKAMAPRVTPEELAMLREAAGLAREAHEGQKRKTGEPYILHPIAVAEIAAEELQLGAAPVMAAFLHDVVEDTPYTLEDIRKRFGEDVAFLVSVVTKRKKKVYESSKQVDNYRQILDSVKYDVRAILIKLADRLHNMRTLSSMRPDKQMKIAGETDYFYAPLANRLGLYNVKTELENLSLRFRCPIDYASVDSMIRRDEEAQRKRLSHFRGEIEKTLREAGFEVEVRIVYRRPYSIWRKMKKYGDDFNHLKYRHFTEIVYSHPASVSEKEMALRIYSVLTDRFREKPGGITNYIDAPKENGYQSFHLKLLADFGRWQEVHISSRRMVRASQLGCMASEGDREGGTWLEKFREVLRDIASQEDPSKDYMQKVVSSFYNDDLMMFSSTGRPVVLPQRATVLDFAYEIGRELGEHARYARVNGFLTSVKAPLRRGDVVEIAATPDATPQPDWLDAVVTYKARKAIREWLDSRPVPVYRRCPTCLPIPCEDVVGIKDADGRITLHKRDCPTAIRLASERGDDIVAIDFTPDETLYPANIEIRAVDRFHLLIDIVDNITNRLGLTMQSFNTATVDSIVTISIALNVHSFDELQNLAASVTAIEGVDEVKIKNTNLSSA